MVLLSSLLAGYPGPTGPTGPAGTSITGPTGPSGEDVGIKALKIAKRKQKR
jgi:hypothetical protein